MFHTLGMLLAHILMVLGAIVAVLVLIGCGFTLFIMFNTEVDALFSNKQDTDDEILNKLKEKLDENSASNHQDC